MKNTCKLLFLLVIISPQAFSQEYVSREDDYCVSQAERQTLRQCNYSVAVRDMYISCMKDSSLGAYDPLYLNTKEKCVDMANNTVQRNCRYGNRYKYNYDSCMESFEKAFKEQVDNRSIFAKMIDSILP